MKKILTLLLVILSANVLAISPDKNMNVELNGIYDSLTSKSDSTDLLNKEFKINLSLKFASEKYLIFHDAYIKTNDKEKYQIAKWQFQKETIKEIIGKDNIKCHVSFKIIKIQKNGPYETMPHIVVQITNIAPNKPIN